MTPDDAISIGKAIHAALVGKIIEVDWFYCYGDDDNFHEYQGPWQVRVDPAAMESDLEEVVAGHYDPNGSVTPLTPPPGTRTHWCSPVTCELATGKWELTFKVVNEPVVEKQKTYRVDMTGLACMRGNITVIAEDKKDAENKARASTGDVEWRYEGMQDETIEYAVEEYT